jgi:hypothetical protein
VTTLAVAVLAALSLLSVPLWRDLPVVPRFRLRAGVLLAIGVIALAVAAWLAVNGAFPTRAQRELAVAFSLLCSLSAGGPVARALLRLADHGTPQDPQGPARTTVLTGGAWIGALERIAVTTTLLARWPEGLALVLAVKGLGRYPELRSADQPGVAERFIIGTFASTLWAVACAGIGLAVLR